jgi:hypothetical protein
MAKFPAILLILVAICTGASAQHYSPPPVPPPNFNNQPMVYNTGPQWEKGSYTDLQGVQHDGFIMEDVNKNKVNVIDYKKERHDNKIAIPVDSVVSIIFSATKDTFVVSHSALLKGQFIREVILKNKIKLYQQPVKASFSFYGVKDTWYYGTSRDDLTLLDKKNFIDIMPQIMADEPGVVQNILNKQYKYRDMVDLITYYQTGREPWRNRDNQQ